MLMNNSRSTLAVLCLAALYTSGDAELVGDVDQQEPLLARMVIVIDGLILAWGV